LLETSIRVIRFFPSPHIVCGRYGEEKTSPAT